MPREKAGFRDNIEILNARFPEKDVLTMREVADWLGVSLRTAYRKIKYNKELGRVSKADLARQISI